MAICLESFQYIMITSLAISPRTIGKIVLQICGIKMLAPAINNPLCEIVQFKTIGWISEWYKCNAIWIMWTYLFDVLTIIIFLLYLNSIWIIIILKPKIQLEIQIYLRTFEGQQSYHAYIYIRNWRSYSNLFWTNITPTSSFL